MKPNLLLFLLLLIAQLVHAQKATRPEAYLPLLLDSAGVPGLSMAVIGPKGVVWAKGFGVREAGKPALVDPQTVFSAASLSKTVFAYLVLKLADKGKIDLDRPLYQYVPYRAIEHDERYKTITARMVLSHQTGFPNWRNGQLNLLFKPGRRFSYSGEGFVYLQGVVTTITGKELDELAQAYVFKPLGMSRSSYRWQPAFDSNYAVPHNRFGQPTALTRYPEANAAYSLQTTAADYGRFLVALLTGEGLKPATAQALFKAQVSTGKTLHDTTQVSASLGWGLGLGVVQEPGNQAFWHWGDNGDFRCFAYVSRTQKRGVVYFTNSRNGLSLLSVLPAQVLGVPMNSVADFLAYDSYRSAPVQVSRLMKKGVPAAVSPFLNKEHAGTAMLGEIDLVDIAEHLSNSSRSNQAIELLELGRTYYPQSTAILQALAFTSLKQGDRDQAATALARYVASRPDDEAARHLLAQLTAPAAGNVTLRLPGFPAARLITLAGSFNNWQPLHTLFLKEGNEWRCTLRLPTGNYAYRIVVDGNWQPDPTNPNTEKDNSGNTNSVLTVRE
ncbi:serine hydrolase [Hymenobacter sp. BT186]|uniref:Serine hydrolase n=1 Tax=Hymenobacter telluris TaxID=2816474 RepID=A0A939EV93_9BACT|nr:serine hydrolase [Hymenobacter telluris]MBO0357784.1 serine hydrolase [Hymenobacter telluris]MBW3373811.1 serine hydrolase [Hymenobacter norwichensis]